MSIPSVPELETAAKELVYKAKAEGTLSQVTPRMIRQELETQFGLEEGALDESEYKKALKRAIKEAVYDSDEVETPAEGTSGTTVPEPGAKPESTVSQPSSTKKRTSDGTTKVDDAGEEEGKAPQDVPFSQTKDKGKAKAIVKDEEEEEEKGGPVKKKPRLSKPRSVKNIESEEEEEVKVTPAKKGKTKAAIRVEDPEDEDEITPKKKRRASTSTTSKPKSKKKKIESESEDEPEDEEESDYQEDEDDEDSKKKKRKSLTSSKPKPKTKKKVVSAEDEEVEVDEEEKEKRAPSKQAAQKAPSSKPKPKERSKSKDNKNYKSLEHVPTSDMEQDEPGSIIVGPPVLTSAQARTKTEEKKASISASPSKSKSSPKVKPNATPRPQKPASAKLNSSGPSKAAPFKAEEDGKKSESEMSVLTDEPPKKKRRSSGGEKVQKASKPKEKKSAKSSTSLSKDEETIKRLKALVVACGTRRVWSKVFQGLDTPQQQIRKLKEILTELGMTGRYSMEQAKAIKEKRELEQELQDVREFERKIIGQSSQKRSDSAPRKSLKDISSDSESGKEGEGSGSEDEGEAPKRRATTARKSIMAFLEDQSEEE